MTVSDIIITIVVSLVVNLMTPMIRKWSVNFYFATRLKMSEATESLLLAQKSRLESELIWYEEKNETKKLLKWLLPHLFNQLVMLWFIALMPLIIILANANPALPNVVGEWLVMGTAVLAFRQFILFILLGTVTQEILSLEDTKTKIGKQISEIENNLLLV